MRLFHLLNLLTFVSCFTSTTIYASPKSVNRPAPVKNPLKSSPEIEKNDVTKEETTQISYPENLSPSSPPPIETVPKPVKDFEVKASQLRLNQFSLIFDSGRFIESETNKNVLIALYKRTLLVMDEAELNLGFGLSPQNLALMQIGQKWNWRSWPTDHGSEYPIYFGFNILNYIDSTQMLAGLINVNHFKLQLALGLDQLEFFQEKFNTEMGLAYGINGFSWSLSLGWNF